ncbi:MAG TPA: site-specific DNA-methyltransferase, partial [Candidatus Diapherotrites archaeon]|nr:site-specific DNA-methyltransferase [Candidatus Diapherotrites archaeon]
FVGSGTTGHAIIETNIEDKSNRKFILCQIDEEIKDENIKKEFKTIADICIERLKRVSSNYKKDIFIYNKDLGFKIFKIN